MKKIFENVKSRRTLANLIVVLVGIAFYMLLNNLTVVREFLKEVMGVISPFVWGLVIAYLLNPAVRFFENKLFSKMKNRKAAHCLGVVVAFVASIAVLTLLLVAIVPQLISSATVLFENLGDYFESFKATLIKLEANAKFIDVDVEGLLGSWSEIFKTVADWAMDNMEDIVDTSYKVGSSLVNFLLALVLSIYILLDLDNLKRMARRVGAASMKEERYMRTREILGRSNEVFMGFLGSNLLDALIIGVANFIFMLIMAMPYPLLISVIVAVTNFIPTFGPIIGAVPCLLIILLINPWAALWFLIWTIVLQLLDANLIKPLLFGDSTGLAPLWVLVAIIIGGRFFGLVGMLIGVPVLAILSWLVNEMIATRLEIKGRDAEGRKSV